MSFTTGLGFTIPSGFTTGLEFNFNTTVSVTGLTRDAEMGTSFVPSVVLFLSGISRWAERGLSGLPHINRVRVNRIYAELGITTAFVESQYPVVYSECSTSAVLVESSNNTLYLES